MTVFALVVAAGNSSRMKGEDKIFSDLGGKEVLLHSLDRLEQCSVVDEIMIITKKDSIEKIKALIKNNRNDDYKKVKSIIEGGEQRQDSVFNGLQALSGKKGDVVLVHNGCNPLVAEDEIVRCVESAQEKGAAVVGFALKDTIKKVNESGEVEKTLDRDCVWQVQTPQCIEYSLFVEGFKRVREEQLDVTDDVSVVEALGKPVHLVECSPHNFKITTQDDLSMARKLIGDSGVVHGIGQDSHRFTDDTNKELVLGGYTINGERGFDANSDGDVILHALYNAISSAIGGRSLSIVADPLCKQGITDSKEYLKPLLKELEQKKLAIKNMSISIEAKTPKLEPYQEKIKESLCSIFCLENTQIGLTFTTGEDMTGMGKGQGMACLCTVILREK